MNEFKIRDRQMNGMQDARLQEFETALVKELRSNFPDALASTTTETLIEFVQSIEALAMNYELETEDQIRSLAIYVMGARTFLGGIPHWFEGIMNETDISPQNRMRMLTLRFEHAMSAERR